MRKNIKPTVVVVGSTNMDLVVRTTRLPKAGETVLGGEFIMNPGGKGANQAVAVAQLGGDCRFITSLGDDDFGKRLVNGLKKQKVNTTAVQWIKNIPSGVALIGVDPSGENQIIVAPGANATLAPDAITRSFKTIKDAKVLLAQLEIPLETVIYSIELAKKRKMTVILNPAPAQKLPAKLFSMIDYLTPNMNEAALLSGIPVKDLSSAEKAGKALIRKGIKTVIMTLGKKGVLVIDKKDSYHLPAPNVPVIDTTAAGDAFNGAFAFALASNYELFAAVQFAIFVAALSVTKPGAQQSMPTLSEVQDFMQGYSYQLA
jgi:ribokinase